MALCAPVMAEQGATDAPGDTEVRDYTYLGTKIGPKSRHALEATRQQVRKKMVQILRVIGRIPALNNVQMSKCMSIAVAGVIGYYGRSTPLSMADCKAIEGARAVAMQQRGFSPSVPHLQIYANARDGGLQHEHAYRVAAAALIDQIDRALCGAEGEPHRAAVKSAIVGACRRLGCRGYSPLEWSRRST